MSELTVIEKKAYSVSMPLNDHDMNFHFIDDEGNDYLVDLQDVIDMYDEDGATIENAIDYAEYFADQGLEFWWMVA